MCNVIYSAQQIVISFADPLRMLLETTSVS